ncbi:MAG: M28 family peptidase [Bacteroidota bacterium]
MKNIFLLISCLLPLSLHAQNLEEILTYLDEEYEAQNAYQTTKYVAQYWRLAGNPGFDSSIYKVKSILESAGYKEETQFPDSRLSYRIESYPLQTPSWEPLKAQIFLEGESEALLDLRTNRNMLAINSYSTPEEGLEAEIVFAKDCASATLDELDLKDKIVFSTCWTGFLFEEAVVKRGALGVITYGIPTYNRPKDYPNSISFGSIPYREDKQSFGIKLSLAAKKRLEKKLKKGSSQAKIFIETRFLAKAELTIIAEIKGKSLSEERFVFSAHVQEPGANDNASGVGAQTEMARAAATLLKEGKINPDRTITFLWGDEIRSTHRYINQDVERARGIKWGMSLDMVGEDTEKTGGSFLIEKMPDPSAIWTRGEDKHTEWGASEVSASQFNPHYFNDLIEYICRERAKENAWTVNTNPYEGGSDHQPFLDANIPALLLWHFTDVFYHTDADLIDKVSPHTLKNVGISALASALFLTQDKEKRSMEILKIVEMAALDRLGKEGALAREQVKKGSPVHEERESLWAWGYWYGRLIPKVKDVLIEEASTELRREINRVLQVVGDKVIEEMASLP